jgi:hypothetical protein
MKLGSVTLENRETHDTDEQWRHQGRCQPAPGHPFGSLKNKVRAVKNDVLSRHFIFLTRTHPTDSF